MTTVAAFMIINTLKCIGWRTHQNSSSSSGRLARDGRYGHLLLAGNQIQESNDKRLKEKEQRSRVAEIFQMNNIKADEFMGKFVREHRTRPEWCGKKNKWKSTYLTLFVSIVNTENIGWNWLRGNWSTKYRSSREGQSATITRAERETESQTTTPKCAGVSVLVSRLSRWTRKPCQLNEMITCSSRSTSHHPSVRVWMHPQVNQDNHQAQACNQ